ncbi:DUF3551 domain-containing protein [Bradyrhizobium guangzhouense]|uniref:DUF3551 domain-containing protein n=1 Tax=Bradyrhizobium guangzhouense TaxID=1325095 RepID=A0AAE5X6C3_9BRAD|nr:DUF3551 domain-containing protein [Bradyrhizobium guangzhouense]QAU49379.1 hypothetical protein XH91_31155 [Bradyrhizobium guangzhouense]RXH11077.1 DUF3551 domain-containing protein [Bradyrhizobium guangzhouense]RXH16075.1 DUF3551 domain-containing protein [Bradyrhizobium guangzhouense]
MRLSLLTLTAIAGLFAAADASAQTYDPRYPVCMHVYSGGGLSGGGGGWFDCSFTSLPQCRASASGRAASCDVNPYYAFDERAPSPSKRHRKVY